MTKTLRENLHTIGLGALAAAMTLTLPLLAHAGGNASAGQEKAQACVACHGEDGNSPNTQFPKLAGQYADYIVRSLEQYQNGERNNVVMKGFATTLNDQDRADLAAWFSSQKSDLGTLNVD